MNPIALRLSAMAVALEGTGHPELIVALEAAEQEILRLEQAATPPTTVRQSIMRTLQQGAVDRELDQLRHMLSFMPPAEVLAIAAVSFHLWSIAMLAGREGLVGCEELFDEVGHTIDARAIAGGWVKP